MKHYEKAKEILGEDFFNYGSDAMSKEAMTNVKSFIDDQIDKGVDEKQIMQQASHYALLESRDSHIRLREKMHQQISDGIKWVAQQGSWTDLKQIAEHAMNEAINCSFNDVGPIGKRMVESLTLKRNFLSCGMHDYPAFIKKLKDSMVGENGLKDRLETLKRNPDSTQAHELISIILDMEEQVSITSEKGYDINIKKSCPSYQVTVSKDEIETMSLESPNKQEAIDCMLESWLNGVE